MKRVLLAILAALLVLPVFAQEGTTLTGKVIVTHVEGKPDVVTFKTDIVDFTLLAGDKVTELIGLPGVAEKTFEIGGMIMPSSAGTSAAFTLKSFKEYTPPPTATPTVTATGTPGQ